MTKAERRPRPTPPQPERFPTSQPRWQIENWAQERCTDFKLQRHTVVIHPGHKSKPGAERGVRRCPVSRQVMIISRLFCNSSSFRPLCVVASRQERSAMPRLSAQKSCKTPRNSSAKKVASPRPYVAAVTHRHPAAILPVSISGIKRVPLRPAYFARVRIHVPLELHRCVFPQIRVFLRRSRFLLG